MPLTPQDLVGIYQRIADERMQGMPFVNRALRVEAVDFRAWDDHQVGVLITPWFMNLILLPGPAGDFVGSIAIAVVLMLVWSLFVALTVIYTGFVGTFLIPI